MMKINLIYDRDKMIRIGNIVRVISYFFLMIASLAQIILIFYAINYAQTNEINRYALLNVYFSFHALSLIILFSIASMKRGLKHAFKVAFSGSGGGLITVLLAPVIAATLLLIVLMTSINYKKTNYFWKAVKLTERDIK